MLFSKYFSYKFNSTILSEVNIIKIDVKHDSNEVNKKIMKYVLNFSSINAVNDTTINESSSKFTSSFSIITFNYSIIEFSHWKQQCIINILHKIHYSVDISLCFPKSNTVHSTFYSVSHIYLYQWPTFTDIISSVHESLCLLTTSCKAKHKPINCLRSMRKLADDTPLQRESVDHFHWLTTVVNNRLFITLTQNNDNFIEQANHNSLNSSSTVLVSRRRLESSARIHTAVPSYKVHKLNTSKMKIITARLYDIKLFAIMLRDIYLFWLSADQLLKEIQARTSFCHPLLNIRVHFQLLNLRIYTRLLSIRVCSQLIDSTRNDVGRVEYQIIHSLYFLKAQMIITDMKYCPINVEVTKQRKHFKYIFLSIDVGYG